MEDRCSGSEAVGRHQRWVADFRSQRRVTVRGPVSTVHDAERAAAGPDYYLRAVVRPVQPVRNIPAVALPLDLHDCFPFRQAGLNFLYRFSRLLAEIGRVCKIAIL